MRYSIKWINGNRELSGGEASTEEDAKIEAKNAFNEILAQAKDDEERDVTKAGKMLVLDTRTDEIIEVISCSDYV